VTVVQPRDHRRAVADVTAMASTLITLVAVIGSVLSLVHHRPWDWGDVVGKSLPGWPAVFLYAGPLNRLLVRKGLLPSAERGGSIPWDLAVRRAATAGFLPPGEDPEEWRPHIRHHIVVRRRLATGFAALFLAISAATGVAAAVTSHNDWTVWALATAEALSGLAMTTLGRQRHRAAHALLESLGPPGSDVHARQVPGRGWQSGPQG
jgi:hypothetical protein